MNGSRRSRRVTQLTQLLTIALTASAVSLQDFQLIGIVQVPSLACLSAYGSTILGCSRGDFQAGAQCSTSCAKGIQQDQANIIAACKHLEINSRSLLGLTLQGGLLDALCPDFQVTSTRETSTTATATSKTEITSTTSTSISTSSETSTTIQSTPSETDTAISSTATEVGSSTTTQSTSAASPTQTAGDGDDGSSRGSSGGGSPFDPVIINSAERILQRNVGGLVALAALTASLIITIPLVG
ncbi:hypothetical protein SAMD00023353_2800610 [Rosellinia necatrix]|uniref:Uncharacterized protein n=1 Tax=Rosellinia necatrix TaxID=77044 RepID=A0A1W2THV3_ROSNE|nr:hypothetical protein SAMD00023353_2800610 [Rosellinia necatrix]